MPSSTAGNRKSMVRMFRVRRLDTTVLLRMFTPCMASVQPSLPPRHADCWQRCSWREWGAWPESSATFMGIVIHQPPSIVEGCRGFLRAKLWKPAYHTISAPPICSLPFCQTELTDTNAILDWWHQQCQR